MLNEDRVMHVVSAMRPDIPDEQIDDVCEGLSQSAAKIRYLRSLGLRVERRPNGRPLVARIEWDRAFGQRHAPMPVGSAPRWKSGAK